MLYSWPGMGWPPVAAVTWWSANVRQTNVNRQTMSHDSPHHRPADVRRIVKLCT